MGETILAVYSHYRHFIVVKLGAPPSTTEHCVNCFGCVNHIQGIYPLQQLLNYS